MNNTRFATAIHIMTLLAQDQQEWLTSDWIAGSVNVNPVVVRKELIHLKKSDLIESRKGKEGGVRIARNPDQISISEIYQAVKNTEVLGKKNQNPNPLCIVGKGINKNLEFLFRETDDLVLQFLKNKKLSDFAKEFN
ncbi:Rrf2 family transcriptional regulator [Epilithonimonas mollis]|uniref:Transcriptional regulator, BadM/Rrf2 family n=1 Tax=Epilithonimonas mollis TaxID=216903 RepID=A0A1M6NFA3_9FLAO|nr:Rrf2 family transcriptional regulator [Epilithonimonas mollis]SHJ94372.1 transcriptional regulator, BadM/Rrf2 family [Epilithonimonas mollis]